MVVPLFVGREKSIKALHEVMKSDKSIVLVTQKNSEIDDPTGQDLFQVGCLSKVLQLLKLPDGTVKVLVEGEKRVKILKHHEKSKEFLNCEVEVINDQNITKELDQLAVGLIKKFESINECDENSYCYFYGDCKYNYYKYDEGKLKLKRVFDGDYLIDEIFYENDKIVEIDYQEDLEINRFLELDIEVRCIELIKGGKAVDTKNDLEEVKKILKKTNF